ncbi:MAG: 23S rRNA (adenine(2503)-C(2))-methyltransferase RlmN, partial [Ilumatobacteraceae bacterium]
MSIASNTSVYDVDRPQLVEMLDGEPNYRIDQLWTGLYTHLQPIADITTVPAALRTKVADVLPEALDLKLTSVSDAGDTTKFLWTLRDGGHPLETVLMHYRDRSTVCVSTQAGCAMACGFCATGQAGFRRQLTAGEIVEQVVRAARLAKQQGRRVANVVMMGMGEPLANEEATWRG